MTFDSPTFHQRHLFNPAITSALTAHCRREEDAMREWTGHPTSYDQGKRVKFLTLLTHGCLMNTSPVIVLLVLVLVLVLLLLLRFILVLLCLSFSFLLVSSSFSSHSLIFIVFHIFHALRIFLFAFQ